MNKINLNFKPKYNFVCGTYILIAVAIIALIFGLWALMMWIGTMLWATIAVSIFGLPALSFWQFAGFYILCRLVFGQKVTVNHKK